MDISVPRTTDLEGTIAEFHEFFDKHKLYLTPQDINGTSLSSCKIVQDEPKLFIRLSKYPISKIRYVGAVLREGKFGGRVEMYRVKDAENYKIALVKQGHVIDETGTVLSQKELIQHPGYQSNKRI